MLRPMWAGDDEQMSKYTDELCAENERLYTSTKELTAQLAAAEKRVAELEKALEFYAKGWTVEQGGYGSVARAALAGNAS
jgi:hypothetical protein